jgi:hypothetical protein
VISCEVELGFASRCSRPATGRVNGALACRECAECWVKKNGRSPAKIVPLVPPAKWLKKDIKCLCGYLDTFYLLNRPLDHRGLDEYLPKVRAVLDDWSKRKDIVLGGIRAARATCSRRYRECCETIGNQLVRFTEYGQPDELIERFTKFAREDDAAEKRLEKMLHRVLAEGLPPEVEAYDPTPGGEMFVAKAVRSGGLPPRSMLVDAAGHSKDEDCTVGPNGCCTTCGVSHTALCNCGGRGFHRPNCPEASR